MWLLLTQKKDFEIGNAENACKNIMNLRKVINLTRNDAVRNSERESNNEDSPMCVVRLQLPSNFD